MSRVAAGGRDVGLPQLLPFTLKPAPAPAYGLAGGFIATFGAAPARRAEDGLGQHEQVTPSKQSVGGGGCGQGPGQALSPHTACRLGHVTLRGHPSLKDFSQVRPSSVLTDIGRGRGLRGSRGSRFGPAPGVGAIVAARHKRTAHLANVKGMLGEIGGRHVPSKGSSAMVVEVGSHAGVSVPATGGGVRARTAQHWAEDTCMGSAAPSTRRCRAGTGRAGWPRMGGFAKAYPPGRPTCPFVAMRLEPVTALLLKETAPTPSEDGLLGGRLPQGEGQVGGSQRARTPINVEAECEVTSAVPPDGRANPGGSVVKMLPGRWRCRQRGTKGHAQAKQSYPWGRRHGRDVAEAGGQARNNGRVANARGLK